MIDILERDTLAALAQHVAWPSVSIHMPTHRAGLDTQQDPIRLKNLLRDASEQLAADLRPPEIDDLLKPARALLDDPSFWRVLGDGLAIFLAEDVFHVFKTDVALPELVTVEERFMIRPLLPALDTGERFYVLALSKNQARLLEGTRDQIREVETTGLPAGLADALKYDEVERQVQFHTRTPAAASGRGKRDAVFHGHGGAGDIEKDRVLRYLRVVDKGLRDFLHDEDAPLLLAGVDYLVPIYREVNSYPHLVEASIPGNPDDLTPLELHTAARAVLKPHFEASVLADLEAFSGLAGSGSASDNLHEIVAASHEGRVKVLFLSEGDPVWGSYDPSNSTVIVHAERQSGDWDLADLAAAETLLHGGDVHAVNEDPAFDPAAAIFRY